MDYEIKNAFYSMQMDELHEYQLELKASAGSFTGVSCWMDVFKKHIHNGD